MSKMFSIIIPSHNGEDRIALALESCFKQTFKDFEVIVICDACTDNTHLVAQRYDTKIIDVDYHKDGLARNAGLDAATGDWILFLDDDDWWLHEYVLQLLSEAAGARGEDALFFSIIWKGRGYTKQTWDHYQTMSAGHCWRRDFIGDTRFDDAPFHSDTHFFLALRAKEPFVTFWDMPLYYYNYMRDGSLTTRWKSGEFDDELQEGERGAKQ